ncbi:ABC transporter permease, partial [Vibrio cholerae]
MKKLLLVLVVISFCSLFVGVGNLSLAALFQGDESAWQ